VIHVGHDGDVADVGADRQGKDMIGAIAGATRRR
jgi:hypothetical protein